MPKAEGLKFEYGGEELIEPSYLETFHFDSPEQYIITETDEFSLSRLASTHPAEPAPTTM